MQKLCFGDGRNIRNLRCLVLSADTAFSMAPLCTYLKQLEVQLDVELLKVTAAVAPGMVEKSQDCVSMAA